MARARSGTRWSALADRLVWLDPIDMEPLPASTNLLAAILARINRASHPHRSTPSAYADSRDRPQPPRLIDSTPDYQEAMLALQELETNVALAWDGNVAGRAGSTDPDTYAVEVMRAEMARLGLNVNVNRVLDLLATRVFDRGVIRDPIFILAIDDFDLNPTRSLELIRLLRAVSTPRLFTIILGDLRVAEAVFSLRVSGTLAATAGPAANGRLLSLQANEVRSIASELASHSLRKMIPPAQRIHIHMMSVAESLRYRPIAADRGPSPSLSEVMSRCLLEIRSGNEGPPEHPGVTNLHDFLLGAGRAATPSGPPRRGLRPRGWRAPGTGPSRYVLSRRRPPNSGDVAPPPRPIHGGPHPEHDAPSGRGLVVPPQRRRRRSTTARRSPFRPRREGRERGPHAELLRPPDLAPRRLERCDRGFDARQPGL